MDLLDNVLTIKDLKYKYSDGTYALNGIDLEVKKGEKLVVLGVNGSGKSTLFKCLNGILRVTEGDIFYRGEKYKYDKKSLINIRKNIGIVFQDPETQLFCVDVYEEVAFGPKNLKYSKEEVQKSVEDSLKNVGMEKYQEKPAHFLSYGQKKRVSIAAVLSMKPEVIIFDEPTSALDPTASKQVIDLIEKFNQQGTTIILSTHDVDLAYRLADRIVIMKNGIIEDIGSSLKIFSNEKLINNANLEVPSILRIFNKLKGCGVIKNDVAPPKNIAELEKYIELI